MKLYELDTLSKCAAVIGQYQPNEVMVAYSGGSDSDTVMEFLRKHGFNVPGVFFNTGFEYQATKDQLQAMRAKGFTIVEAPVYKTVPVSIKHRGQPFFSKHVSDCVQRLQRHNFTWKDGTFEELLTEFPRCKSALRWWCNNWALKRKNISWNPLLKEFLIANPPAFKIDSMCCIWAKKMASLNYCKAHGIKLVITGMRKAEGGARANLTSCVKPYSDHTPYTTYHLLFWWSDKDKAEWDSENGITHSACYTEYGLKRTGCAGCPFGKDHEEELAILKKHEPRLHKAAKFLFKESYEYMNQFEAFRKANKKAKQ